VSTLARLLIPLALVAVVIVSAATATHPSQATQPEPRRTLMSHR